MPKVKCCNCKERFDRAASIKLNAGYFHSYECATEYGKTKAKKQRVTKAKQDHTKAKRKLRDEDRPYQLKKTQQIFNKYIRLRDMADPCISCGRYHTGQYHAGHYRSVGANPELRFLPANCHKQCSACNNHLSGNISNYHINLVGKIGGEAVSWVEGSHPPKRYTIEQLKILQRWFTRKTKRLEQLGDD